MEPLVSVCIPAYNNAEYIKDTIDSILNQTYQNIELVIVDDNSKDNTYELIQEIGDERIKLYHNADLLVPYSRLTENSLFISLFSRPLHHISRSAFRQIFLLHKIHIGCYVVKKLIISLTQVIQSRFTVFT